MNKIMSRILICFLIILNVPFKCFATEDIDTYNIEMKQDILSMMMSYPGYIKNVEKNDKDQVFLILKSGKRVLYDDKVVKAHEEKLANPDIQDLLEQDYPLVKIEGVLDKNFDPGRSRYYDILTEVYGNSQETIQKNLVNLKYGYTNYQFNSQNGASDALDKTLRELVSLSQGSSEIGNILYPANGTYNHRLISGTGRLSPHAFGIAIDLKSDPRDYWKWATTEKGSSRIKEYPKALIDTFENNGFIWGGKWSHFDILHFEYRPEIIFKAKHFQSFKGDGEWYGDVDTNDNYTKECIDLINSSGI